MICSTGQQNCEACLKCSRCTGCHYVLTKLWGYDLCFCCALQGLAAKAEQLLVTTFELQELRQQHDSLQRSLSLQEVQQQLTSTSHDLEEAQ